MNQNSLWLPPSEPATVLTLNWQNYVANGRTDVFPFTDDKRLLGAQRAESRYPIAVYDDGYGPLWIHRDSMGISGIVRASTFEDAYSICEDEFFPAGDEDAARDHEDIETAHDQDCWDEAYGYRGNGRKESDGSISYIYAKDLNGDTLQPLTPELAAELELVFVIEIEQPF